MSLRYRIPVFFAQIAILCVATFIATGTIFSALPWYTAGLLVVIINPQLLEPYFPKPVDVIGNSIFALILIFTSSREIAEFGWIILTIILIIALVNGFIATIWGAGRNIESIKLVPRVANIISREATSARIYSLVFFLSLVETYPLDNVAFWIISLGWLLIVFIGTLPWDRIIKEINRSKKVCSPQGMLGPNFLQIRGNNIPTKGNLIKFQLNEKEIIGIVTSRIKRLNDTWGEVHISDAFDCEFLLGQSVCEFQVLDEDNHVIGAVYAGSDETTLAFYPIEDLHIGEVVAISINDLEIYYQIFSARIESWSIKDGSHLRVITYANQIGYFNKEKMRLEKFIWVAEPGKSVFGHSDFESHRIENIPDNFFQLGNVIGGDIPVFLNLDDVCTGHLAILGMTKMGKTTLAHELSKTLAKKFPVVILDQTGEFKNKKKVQQFDETKDLSQPGLSVYEPKINSVNSVFALGFLKQVMKIAQDEYNQGQLQQRVIVIDEAHQFVPEPAGLGFNNRGRQAAMDFGLLMMQVRKYGITIILISQRTAVVAKSALSQCENIIAFKSVDKTGLDYLETIAGKQYSEILPNLQQGQALVFGPAFSSDLPVSLDITKY